MSTIQSLNSGSAAYSTALASTATPAPSAQASQAAQSAQSTQTTQGQDVWQKKHGDGSVIASLKASLAAQGFSLANSGMSKADYEKAMHDFTHAAFAAAHAQKQTDHAGSQGNTTDTATAFSELADEAANGNAPADLQAAFVALQQTQTSGNGTNATLAQVLQGMSQTQGENLINNGAGSLIDVTA